MKRIFVDAVAWIALLNSRDSLHQTAKQLMMSFQQQNVSLVTTEFVLLEVADALSSPASREVTVAYVKRLRVLNRLEIIPVSQTLLFEGWTLYSQRPDKEWGLTDCISFVVMSQQQLTQAFTSDRHFKQAGFANLL
ncbi:MAG: PIN domain-containing protein [Tildeniella nuda ZEHNDER 1965/U140]|nr:PIN domain-containing protein [Tildeniella nuda ZEHNDER 1965/U140]